MSWCSSLDATNNCNRRKTTIAVKWQDIKRRGRIAWFLSRDRRARKQELRSKQKIDDVRKVLSFLSSEFCKCNLTRRKENESEISSLLSDAATQIDEVAEDDLEGYSIRMHDVAGAIDDEGLGSSCAPVMNHSGCSIADARPAKRSAGSLVALDCEMVGGGPQRRKNLLARCAILDEEGSVILDEYILPDEPVTDYRTRWSGIRPRDLVGAPSFCEVRQRVAAALRGRILIGHALDNDLRALRLVHPPALVRDTAVYPGLRLELAAADSSYTCDQMPSLRRLSKAVLRREIQVGEHSPVEDARAALELYARHRHAWEASLHRP